MGNHDHAGNQTAQVDYMYQTPDSNFKMPAFYYTIEIEKTKDLSLKLIMIDTMIMLDSKEISKLPDADIRNQVFTNTRQKKRLKQLLEKPYRDYQEEQNQWLEKELENCFATYCIVAGHHPMYSIGSHGPTSKVIKYLQPMLVNIVNSVLGFNFSAQTQS